MSKTAGGDAIIPSPSRKAAFAMCGIGGIWGGGGRQAAGRMVAAAKLLASSLAGARAALVRGRAQRRLNAARSAPPVSALGDARTISSTATCFASSGLRIVSPIVASPRR